MLKFFFGLILNLDILAFLGLFVGIFLVAFKKKKAGRAMVTVSCAILFFIFVSPVPRMMLHHLEHKFPENPPIAEAKGLILLGGFFSLLESRENERPVYNKAAGRLVEFLALALKNPTLPIVFTGTPLETALTKKVFADFGISESRVTYEDQARNTVDNARNSFNLVKPKDGDVWVLVTSAFHMPRSVGLFQGAGWKVIPYPVDYHTTRKGAEPLYTGFLSKMNASAWFSACKEWAGMVNNYIDGRSSF